MIFCILVCISSLFISARYLKIWFKFYTNGFFKLKLAWVQNFSPHPFIFILRLFPHFFGWENFFCLSFSFLFLVVGESGDVGGQGRFEWGFCIIVWEEDASREKGPLACIDYK